MNILDITRSIVPDMAVWPGDEPYETRWTSRFEDGELVNVGAVRMSTHTGTHADAPFHVLKNGKTIDKLSLETLIGTVYVIDTGKADSIRPEHLKGIDLQNVRRILFRSRSSSRDSLEWKTNFTFIDPETAKILVKAGVLLVGTDAPSVDPFDSHELPCHILFSQSDIIILENLSLQHVTSGIYQLIALPIKLKGMDAAPIRAVLLSNENTSHK